MSLADLKKHIKSGELYFCTDPELAHDQLLCLDKLYDFNQTRPTQQERRQELLKELFAEIGENCYIEPPLHANWGCNTHFGNNVYANMGLLCGLAGIVLSARNASATPKAGDGFEMDAIASCYIGGAATSGGVGTIIGAVVGAFIMGILNIGMSLAGFDTNVQKIVKGAVLLGAVTVDLVSKRKKG